MHRRKSRCFWLSCQRRKVKDFFIKFKKKSHFAELAVVQEELQRKKQIAGSTEVLLMADNLQQYVKKIEVDRGKITYTEFLL